MSYQVKRSAATTAKFKSFLVSADRNFIDSETGSLISIADVIAKTFGEDTPVDIQVSLKSDEDITDEV